MKRRYPNPISPRTRPNAYTPQKHTASAQSHRLSPVWRVCGGFLSPNPYMRQVSILAVMAEPGIKAGNELIREIVALKVRSKYRIARDLGVTDQALNHWLKGAHSPSEDNYLKLKDYRLWIDKISKIKPFGA